MKKLTTQIHNIKCSGEWVEC